MNCVVALDAAWGGMGYCVATEQGPVYSGHVTLSGFTWKLAALDRWLEDVLAPMAIEAELLRGPGDPKARLVIEQPPLVYAGKDRGFGKKRADGEPAQRGMAGNQSAICFGMGRLAGAIELWWYRRGLGYPWLVPPGAWRTWAKVGGKGRNDRKRRAVEKVVLLGWGEHLRPHRWKDDGGGPRGDVAEAILLGVGAAQHAKEAPEGPAVAIIDPRSKPKRSPRKKKP